MNILDKIVAHGNKYLGESRMDGGIWWALFHVDDVPEDDGDLLESLDLFPYSGGPGQYFCCTPLVDRVRSRVLVTQRWGLDI
jgi:hypothetical protein